MKATLYTSPNFPNRTYKLYEPSHPPVDMPAYPIRRVVSAPPSYRPVQLSPPRPPVITRSVIYKRSQVPVPIRHIPVIQNHPSSPVIPTPEIPTQSSLHTPVRNPVVTSPTPVSKPSSKKSVQFQEPESDLSPLEQAQASLSVMQPLVTQLLETVTEKIVALDHCESMLRQCLEKIRANNDTISALSQQVIELTKQNIALTDTVDAAGQRTRQLESHIRAQAKRPSVSTTAPIKVRPTRKQPLRTHWR